MHDPVAYHLIARDEWDGANAAQAISRPSLERDGFVHLTHRMADLVEVANELYRGDPRPHVVLTVSLRALASPWRYDGDDRYPHVYGPLDREAITEVRGIDRRPDGTFLPIERPDPRRPPEMAVLLGRLVDAGVSFVVIGSGGAALLGAHVVPGDLDVCADRNPANLARLGEFLTSIQARPRVSVPGWVTEEEAAAWRPGDTADTLELLFETAYGDFDVLFGSLGADRRTDVPYEDLLPSAVAVDVDGRRVSVASPEHLVASKLAARRPKDLRAKAALDRLIAERARNAGGQP